MPKRSFAEKYQTAAVVIVNTAVLTAVVLLALHLAFPLERSIWEQNLGGRRLSDDLVPAHYYLTGAEETGEIRAALDDYVLAGHWQVHPWTGLINRRYASEHLNVDAQGRRRTVEPSAAHAGRPPFEVWAFGGSTLFGWGLSDAFTVPSQLQVALQERLPERRVRVSNFGVPWYNSAHEVALLVANLRRAAAPPAAAVFLHGLNDLVHRTHYRTESPLHPQLVRAWEERLEALFAPPPWLRLAPSFPLVRAARALGDPGATTLGGLYGPEDPAGQAALVRRAAEDYATNRRLASAVCAELGVAPFFLLQPVPMWLDAARDATTDPGYNAFADLVLEPRGEPRTLDLRGALAALDPQYAMTVEATGAHYSDVASRVLGEAIADLVATSIESER